MRNVKRSKEPRSLAKNAAAWTRNLLIGIRACEKAGKRVPDSYFKDYKKPDVQRQLNAMYKGLCCYCEGRIGTVSYGHIEHRKPKRKFPKYAFKWENLHLACQVCNSIKGKKWKDSAPILDAVQDVPITAHLTYMESGTGLRRWPLSEEGETTIDHADLNRQEPENLLWERTSVLLEVLRILRKLRSLDTLKATAVKQELRDKTDGAYGSVIEWALENYCQLQT